MVIRCSRFECPRIFRSSQSFHSAVGRLENTDTICHGFRTDTEAAIYLEAAGEELPLLLPRRNGNAFEWRRRRAGAATVRGLCSLHPRDCRRGGWFGFCSGFGGASEGVRASSGFAQPILHGGGHCFSNVGRARRDARSIYHQEAACFADREFWRRSTLQRSRGGGGCSFDGFHQRGFASPFPLRSFKPALGHGSLLPRFHQ